MSTTKFAHGQEVVFKGESWWVERVIEHTRNDWSVYLAVTPSTGTTATSIPERENEYVLAKEDSVPETITTSDGVFFRTRSVHMEVTIPESNLEYTAKDLEIINRDKAKGALGV